VYSEDYKNPEEELKPVSRWRDIPCPWIRRLYIIKMSNFNVLSFIECNPNQNLNKLFFFFSIKSGSKISFGIRDITKWWST
jgi:hypothetical protein